MLQHFPTSLLQQAFSQGIRPRGGGGGGRTGHGDDEEEKEEEEAAKWSRMEDQEQMKEQE